MGSPFYLRLQGKADALIRKFGAVCTIRREQQGAYNPASGQNAVTETTFSVPIVTFPYEQRFINGTTIKQFDLFGLFSAVGLTNVPQSGDKCLHPDGKTYTFVFVKPLNPGGIVLEYECQLTQG